MISKIAMYDAWYASSVYKCIGQIDMNAVCRYLISNINIALNQTSRTRTRVVRPAGYTAFVFKINETFPIFFSQQMTNSIKNLRDHR